jgi:hypothetical protein
VIRLAGALLLAAAASPASAQDAPPLVEDDVFALDVVNTPVLGGGRILGLGGAYTALADGVDGAPWNPAAYGSRTLWELDWFEWELSFGFLRPSNDFFNSGGRVVDGLTVLTFGLRLQFGDIGIGALPRTIAYDVPEVGGSVAITTGSYGVAFQLLDGQLVVGAGLRIGDLTVTQVDELTVTGTGPELGVLLKLEGQPWRLGVATRTAVVSEDPICNDNDGDGVCRVDWVLPTDVYLPWEVQAGFAVQIGRRPLNRRWTDPEIEEQRIEDHVALARWERERAQVEREMVAGSEPAPPPDPYRWLPRRPRDPAFWEREAAIREREDERIEERFERWDDRTDDEIAALPRLYLLLSADLLVIGPTPRGLSIEGFATQTWIRSGEEVSYSVRLGAEAEPWGGRLKLRAGTYLEPSRYTGGEYRIHGTGGFDLRLFTWDLFGLFDDFDLRVGAAIDVAARYLDWGISVGFWH